MLNVKRVLNNIVPRVSEEKTLAKKGRNTQVLKIYNL